MRAFLLRKYLILLLLFLNMQKAWLQQTQDTLVGISLDEVVLVEDSLVALEIEQAGKRFIFNAPDYNDFEIDSIRQSLQWKKMGLNEYGINTKAFNLIAAIRHRLKGVQQLNPATGFIRLRASNSINNTKIVPTFIVDGQLFEIPNEAIEDAQTRGIPLWNYLPNVALDEIVSVEVLQSLAETVRYGLQGSAGVIRITTKNALKKKTAKSTVEPVASKTKPTAVLFESASVSGPIWPGCQVVEQLKSCFKESLKKYMEEQIRYPKGIQGQPEVRVYIQIYIDAYGNISDYRARTEEGRTPFAREAFRVLKTLPKFSPAKQGEKAVGLSYAFMVLFDENTKTSI